MAERNRLVKESEKRKKKAIKTLNNTVIFCFTAVIANICPLKTSETISYHKERLPTKTLLAGCTMLISKSWNKKMFYAQDQNLQHTEQSLCHYIVLNIYKSEIHHLLGLLQCQENCLQSSTSQIAPEHC